MIIHMSTALILGFMLKAIESDDFTRVFATLAKGDVCMYVCMFISIP